MRKSNQINLRMTASEIAMGRYMRAPDHDGGGDGGGDGTSSGADSQDGGSSGDDGGDDQLTTEQALEKEFGQEEPPADGDDTNADEGEEDQGSDPDDGDDGEGEADGDDDGNDDAGEGNDDADNDGDGKPKSRSQKRFDELTAGRREAERAAAEATRQAEYWRGRAEGKPEDGGDVPANEQAEDAEPKAADYEFGEADPKYVADLARHEAVKTVREEQRVAGIRTQLHDMEAKYQTNVASVGEKYPDYDEVVTKGAEKETWKCSALVSLGIRNSDVGTDVAYHLASNPQEAERISGLTDIEQAQEFGRLEGRFMAEATRQKSDDGDGDDGEKKKRKHVSSAPKPPKNRPRGKGGKFTVAPDTNDFAAFDKKYGN